MKYILMLLFSAIMMVACYQKAGGSLLFTAPPLEMGTEGASDVKVGVKIQNIKELHYILTDQEGVPVAEAGAFKSQDGDYSLRLKMAINNEVEGIFAGVEPPGSILLPILPAGKKQVLQNVKISIDFKGGELLVPGGGRVEVPFGSATVSTIEGAYFYRIRLRVAGMDLD